MQNTGRSEAPSRLEFLDGFRAIAALTVLVHHAQLEVWDGTHSLTHYLGRLSVDIFIVLSGFCLTLPVARGRELRGGALGFLGRRAWRILPPFYLAAAFSLLLIWTLIGHKTGTHWDASLPVTAHGVVANALMLQDVVHKGEINHAFWSVAVEWKIYLLFPLLLLVVARVGALTTTLAAVVAGLAACELLRGTTLLDLTPHYLGLFALGMLAAFVVFAREGRLAALRARLPWRGMGVALGALVVALVLLRFGVSLASRECELLDTVVGMSTAALLVAVATRPTQRLGRVTSSAPLVAIGGFSYSLYLVHAPLLQVIWQYALHPLHLGGATTFLLLVGLGGPACVGAAYLFFRACERPFMGRGPVESMFERLAARRG